MPGQISRPRASLNKKPVEVIQAEVEAIDPELPSDYPVISLGVRLAPEQWRHSVAGNGQDACQRATGRYVQDRGRCIRG